MLMKGITLRGLEVFEALAESGSVARTAETIGLSQPAVSQQLSNLERAVGTELVVRGTRPMRLTPAGRGFLLRTTAALSELRLAQGELTVMDLSDLSTLSIGLIDDFDHDLTPRLVTILADNLSRCRFKLITAPSLEISAAMQERKFHIAVAASTGQLLNDVVEYPLLTDPFILVAPRDVMNTREPVIADLTLLPLLRYTGEQLIGRQIETHLTREGLHFENRFEVGSHLALMAMVARRIGWAITTPLGYMRAARFHDKIEAFPLPFAALSRTISLFAGTDWNEHVPRDIAQTMRHLLQSQIIDPALSRLPWLAGNLRVIKA
ncbi:LysR family transcriptional regulator [Pontibaca salina]|uniref:LysR family transcriptional regulator n=1 Tax=Pontibaca salina TaxID=2795731 RepID=A0A934HRK8_9RHOB|nr:LysR family transcriptional regulator [Pontibaca salina]MBI6630157.1 LysR family transcriptional regulator [Pontibaca salina]